MTNQQSTTSADRSKWSEDLFESLPGGETIRKGFSDLEQGLTTVHSLLVLIGGPRLRNSGLNVPNATDNPEHKLYDLLAQHDSDSAHSRYNALVRTLVSFERALSCVKR